MDQADSNKQILAADSFLANQIPTDSTRRFTVDPRYSANDDPPSTMSNTDPISFNTPSRSYVNSHPKYYPDISYHGYDISRDISEYPVGEVNNDSSSITPVPKPRQNRPRVASETSATNKKSHREQWSGRFDFFFSSLGYAVGLGAIWRFPYLCYRNGGGVFLIPYVIFLFILGIPLYFLEINLGQFTSQGPVQCWKMAPILKGLGFSMSTMSFFLSVYYAMLIGYAILYFILSFRSNLEWATCGPWASQNCVSDFTNFVVPCNRENQEKLPDGRCRTWFDGQSISDEWWDIKKRIEFRPPVLPSDDYFNNQILNKSPGFDYISTMEWPLVLCLLGTWVLVFLCLFRGIKMSGKIVYFTSVFPYIILLILGIRGWTLPGMSRGIYFYMKPDLARLADPRVWNDAANQIFFVLSVSYGGLITLASYNKFNQPTLTNTFLVNIANVLTSIFAGFVIFAYLGYLSFITGRPVEDVVSEGPGLAFVVYPYAVTTLPVAPLWSILFFFMLILLGLDSVFASVETIVVVITDQLHGLRRYSSLVTLAVCTAMFGLGLILCTDAGIYWVTFFDQYTGSYPAYIIGFFECICIAYVYGGNNFRADIKTMLGKNNWSVRVYRIFQVCWMIITPVVLIGLIVFTSISFPVLQIGNYRFPKLAYDLGWGLMCLIISGTVFYAIYAIIKLVIIERQPVSALFNPEASWGPLLEQNRKKTKYYQRRHQGALIKALNNLKEKTISRQNLTKSKSADLDQLETEIPVSSPGAGNGTGSESAV